MSIEFYIVGNELIMVYYPSYGLEEIKKRIIEDGGYSIKHVFFVTKELIRDDVVDAYLDDSISFCIGTVNKGFVEISQKVINTNHRFFFSENIKLKQDMFVAPYNISILSKIDKVIDEDFYVVKDNDDVNGIPIETYNNMIKHFPKSTELAYYTSSRISYLLNEWIPGCDKYKEIFEKFIVNKTNRLARKKSNYISESNIEIELAQFTVARDELQDILSYSEGADEKTWQERIYSIISLLYPQYIYSSREIELEGIDEHNKQPDFILMDTNGFIDILEIKKPDVQLITNKPSYRNNYIPVREFSGAVQQVEKYIYCLSSIEKNLKIVTKKISERFSSNIKPKIISPKGLLLLGRSDRFNKQQIRDFEIIKRQYKNITDILTCDDLINRFNNIIISLNQKKKNILKEN